MRNERQEASSSHILNFYNDVQYLNHHFANYLNIVIELKHKNDDFKESGELASLDEAGSENITNLVQTIRYYLHQFILKYKGICTGTTLEEDKEIEQLYENMLEEKNFIPPVETLKKFVQKANNVLITDVISNLLTTSQEIYTQIYGNEKRV